MKTERAWGCYTVLYEYDPTMKVKELYVEPRKSLSLQRHRERSEHWTVIEGAPTVLLGKTSKNVKTHYLTVHDRVDIPVGHWHQLRNDTEYPVKILEIQYGSGCIEEDIERL